MTQLQLADLLANITSGEGHVTPEQAAAALRLPIPVCFVSPYGRLLAGNLLNYWTWDCLRLGEPIVPELLIGHEVFNFVIDRLYCMPFHMNHDAVKTKRIIAILADAGRELDSFYPFILHTSHRLKQEGYSIPSIEAVLSSTEYSLRRVWKYPIHLIDPLYRNLDACLRFDVTVKRALDRNNEACGFLVVYSPTSNKDTVGRITAIFEQIGKRYGNSNYVQWEQVAHKGDSLPRSNAVLNELQRWSDNVVRSSSPGIAPYFNTAAEKVRADLAKSDPPAWLLTVQGDVVAANPAMFYLWEALEPGQPLRPANLIGRNVFELFAAALTSTRIPDAPSELIKRLIQAKAAVHKVVSKHFHREAYDRFTAALRQRPQLWQIYEETPETHELQWSYDLNIRRPFSHHSLDLLHFEATVVLVKSGETPSGYLAIYQATPATQEPLKDEFAIVRNRYVGCLPEPRYPQYYPALAQDSFLNVTWENDALQWLLGDWTGHHFLQLIFSPKFRDSVQRAGDDWRTQAERAIKYFHFVSSDLSEKDSDHHDAYLQIIDQLKREIPAEPDGSPFAVVYEEAIRSPLPVGHPFFRGQYNPVCSLAFPSPWSPNMTLQFASRVWFPKEGLTTERGENYFREVLVPDNDETKIALILTYLLRSESVRQHIGDGLLQRLKWGLAAIQTLSEGLRRGESDPLWSPVQSFLYVWDKLRDRASENDTSLAIEIRSAICSLISGPSPLSEDSIVLVSWVSSLSGTDPEPIVQLAIALRGDNVYNGDWLLNRLKMEREHLNRFYARESARMEQRDAQMEAKPKVPFREREMSPAIRAFREGWDRSTEPWDRQVADTSISLPPLSEDTPALRAFREGWDRQ